MFSGCCKRYRIHFMFFCLSFNVSLHVTQQTCYDCYNGFTFHSHKYNFHFKMLQKASPSWAHINTDATCGGRRVSSGLSESSMQGFLKYYPFKGSQIIGAFKGFTDSYHQIPKHPIRLHPHSSELNTASKVVLFEFSHVPQRVSGVYSAFKCRYWNFLSSKDSSLRALITFIAPFKRRNRLTFNHEEGMSVPNIGTSRAFAKISN